MTRFLPLLMAFGLSVLGVTAARGQAADPAGILLVAGTASTPNELERNLSQSVTRRFDRWLRQWDIPHTLLKDEDLAGRVPASARIVILPYNSRPPAAELASLKRFLGQGGRLIVFYGNDPELAQAMNMQLGPYQSSGAPARWCAIRFAAGAPPHAPARVVQGSTNIRPALAIEGRSQTVAVWEDAAGRPLPDPAWTVSERGAWMSHVLLDDGDTASKQQMLLAMLAQYDPALWRFAAGANLADKEPIGRFATFEQAVEAVSGQLTAADDGRRARLALTRAEGLHEAGRLLFGQGRYPEVLPKTLAARAAMAEAYAACQPPRAGEMHGVWDHSGMGLYPGDWGRTCDFLVAQGITDVFPNELWAGSAHYDSAVLPRSDIGRLYGDQLQACVAAAHKRGLRVHVWKVCWRLEGAKPELVARMRAEGRLQKSDTGAELPWLCPSHPDNLRQEKDAVRELVRLAPVDGVHLDYIRFKDGHYCYCDNCRHAFERQLGRRVESWPDDVRRWPLTKDYRAWRCRQIARLVQDVSAVARSANPNIKVSAAVFGKYPSCVDGVGQDWVAWLNAGYVDFVCPMNYTEDLKQFNAYVRSQVSLPGAHGRIYPGIGVTATESRLDALQVIDQIAALREAGAPGFVLFDLNPVLSADILPLLRLGVTAPR